MFVVIGTTTVDLFISGVETMPHSDGDEFTASSLAFCSRPLTMSVGGNGANSAYVLASLGAKAALCSAAGQDNLGNLVSGWLAGRGVDQRGLIRSVQYGTPTTTAVTFANGSRISFHYPGLSPIFSERDLPSDVLEGARALLVTGYTLIRGFRSGGAAGVLQAAKERGALTALDIGPTIDPPAVLDEVRPALPFVDYLFANEIELAACVGASDLSAAACRLLDEGAGSVVLKRGPEGVRLYQREGAVDIPAFPVAATVTVGAGDSFNSGFLFAVHQGKTPADAARFGAATAALVLSSPQTVLGAPTQAQVEAYLKEQP